MILEDWRLIMTTFASFFDVTIQIVIKIIAHAHINTVGPFLSQDVLVVTSVSSISMYKLNKLTVKK